MSENLEKVEKGIDALLAKQAEIDAAVKAAADRAEAAEAKAAAIEKAHADGMSEVRALLEAKTSAPEAKELEKGFRVFLHEAFMHAKYGRPMSKGHEQPHLEQKSVADFVTTTDATAGYLVPRIYNGIIMTANEMYGQLMPLLTNRLTIPAGVNTPVNARSTNPAATWNVQGVDITETEFVYEQELVNPKRLATVIKASNEMLAAPNTGFSANVTDGFLRAFVKAKEAAVIVGTTGTTTAPSDGILVQSGVSDQTNLASTISAVWTFVGESIVDNAELADMNNAIIVTTPAKYNTLVGLISGDASTGIATFVNGQFKVGGYSVYQHPSCLISTTHWITMFNPRDIVVAETGDMAIEFNPFGTGWLSNETWIRAVTHMDFSLAGGLHEKFSKADFS